MVYVTTDTQQMNRQKRQLKLIVLVRNPTSLEVRPAQLEVLC